MLTILTIVTLTLATFLSLASPAFAQTFRRVSEASDGTAGNAASGAALYDNVASSFRSVAISENGRWVAFVSHASNLVPGDTNFSPDVFVKDLDTGAIQRVSVDTVGAEHTGDSGLDGLDISDDGRFVAFSSRAALSPNDTNECPQFSNDSCIDVYLADRETDEVRRISESSLHAQGDGVSHRPRMSADGRYVVFESAATTLVANDTNNATDIFLYDRLAPSPELTLVRVTGGNFNTPQGDGASTNPVIGPDGRLIAFVSRATNLDTAPDPLTCDQTAGPCARAYLFDTEAVTTTRVPFEGGAFPIEVTQVIMDQQGTWIAAEMHGPLPAVTSSLQIHNRLTGRNVLVPANRTTLYGVPSAQISADGRMVNGNWYEGHLSAATTGTGTRWVLAEGLAGDQQESSTDTYILIANTGETDGNVTIRLLPEDTSIEPIETTVAVLANARVSISARDLAPTLPFLGNFGAIIESDGIPIVVERAMYTTVNGVFWQSGAAALATKLDVQP